MKIATLNFDTQSFKRFYVTSQNEFSICCAKLLGSKASRLGLDIETGKHPAWLKFEPVKRGKRIIGPAPGLCPLLSFIRLIQVYDPISKIVYVFDIGLVGNAYVKGSNLFNVLLKEKKFLAHNGVFEIKHFTNYGFPDMHVDCSMLLSIMVDRSERSPFEPEEEDDEEEENDGLSKYKNAKFSLDDVTQKIFGVRISKAYQTSDWNLPELSKNQINYAALDAFLTYEIGIRQMKKIKKLGMKKAYEVDRDMQHVVADMELTGIPFDIKEHTKLIKIWTKDHAEYSAECKERFGKLNLRSSKQLNEWGMEKYPEELIELWPKTKKGVISFGKNALKEVIDIIERKYKKKSRGLSALLKFKTVDKLLSTYGETLQSIIHPVTNRLHCSFGIGETRTGRTSARTPNLQNLPRDTKERSFRYIFAAPENRELIVADYSQIEIRTQAALSKDPVMTNAFIKGIDLHKYILKMCFGWKLKDITKEQRQMGKAINFGFAFGMGSKKFGKYALTSYDVKVTDSQANKAFKTYHSLYNVYSKWCDKERDRCARLGFIRTPLGRIRKLLPNEQYTRAVNTQVQGGAAEVIKLALIDIRKSVDRANTKLILTVHDEIILETNKGWAREKTTLEQCMEYAFTRIFPDAPINNLVEAKAGKNWAECKG